MGKNRHPNGAVEDAAIARELCYPKKVAELLLKEPDADKRSKILRDARLGKYDK